MTWPDSKLIYQPQNIQVASHEGFTAERTFSLGKRTPYAEFKSDVIHCPPNVLAFPGIIFI